MSTTFDLLRRLAALDERCLYDADYNEGCGRGEAVYDLDFGHTLGMLEGPRYTLSVVRSRPLEPLERYVLQGWLQERIEAQGWEFDLSLEYTAGGKYLGYLPIRRRNPPENEHPDCLGGSDCPATALLEAYVQALEARPAGEPASEPAGEPVA